MMPRVYDSFKGLVLKDKELEFEDELLKEAVKKIREDPRISLNEIARQLGVYPMKLFRAMKRHR